MAAGCQLPDPIFVFLHRFGTHLHRPTRHVKPDKGESLAECRDVSLLGAERQAELFNEQLDGLMCLLRLMFRPAEYDEIVGVSHEAIPQFVEVPVEKVQGDIRQQWR